MADPIDISQFESDFLLSLKLRTRVKYTGESADYCQHCGDDIPLARQKAIPGVLTCVFCAAQLENKTPR